MTNHSNSKSIQLTVTNLYVILFKLQWQNFPSINTKQFITSEILVTIVTHLIECWMYNPAFLDSYGPIGVKLVIFVY